jgi:ATP-binding cassette subfamily B protein
MVAKFYGKSFSLQALRSKSFISNSGVSMLGISDAAGSFLILQGAGGLEHGVK